MRRRLEPRGDDMRAKINHADPVRNAKIAAAKRGKRRPAHVCAAVRRAQLGRQQSLEQRQATSERNRQRGVRPPKAGRPWTLEEDELLRTLPAAEVVKRTGRTLGAVRMRQQMLRRRNAEASQES